MRKTAAILLSAGLCACQSGPSLPQLEQRNAALMQQMQATALAPYRQWHAETPPRCSSPTLANASGTVIYAATLEADRPNIGDVYTSINWVFLVADGAREHGCVGAARGLYDFVISTYIGGAYTAFRERARIGIDDLRSVTPAP